MRSKIQAFGGFLTAMVIPNMGAFIAWGFITALFLQTGWIPNAHLAELIGPMLHYLLPLLLAYTGGCLIYDKRGGVAGTIGTIGLIIGADIAMFLGAMIMGPLSAWIVKKFDKLIAKKIPTGLEMVINNFSLGIIGFLLCIGSFLFIGPLIEQANSFVSFLIQQLVKTGFLPILSLVNEPAKVLFLNNVIDQGIYYPLGMQQTMDIGKSIYFMVASNPGAGLGLLIAYAMFGKGDAKRSAPGAMIIHFLGGIHEIYFPYVLMNPILILAMILGNGAGTLVFSLFNVGLVAGPSPGSVFAYLMLTPKGDFLGVAAGVLVSVIVGFLVASAILKASKETTDEQLQASREKSKAMKQEGKDILADTLGTDSAASSPAPIAASPIRFIAFACDAGMGSSSMGANAFRKKLAAADVELQVKHFAIENVPSDADVIVVHQNLVERARMASPDKRIIAIKTYMGDKALDAFAQEIIDQHKKEVQS